jgi:hypothetical protein
VTRSIGRRHRIVSLAAAAAALLTVGLASGCGAGQLAATSRIVAAVPGGSAVVSVHNPVDPNSEIQVQNATIVFSAAGYAVGSTAPLMLTVFNQTDAPITVAPGTAQLQSNLGVNHPQMTDAGSLTWVTAGTGASGAPTPSDSTSPSALASPSGLPSPSGSVSPSVSPSGSVSPSALPSPSAPATPPLTIASAGFVTLDPSQPQYLAITGLTRAISSGDVVNITLTFVYKNQPYSTTIAATFAPPLSAPSRAPVSPGSPA